MVNNSEGKPLEKLHFVLRSSSPQTAFSPHMSDMTEDQRNIMQRHIAYVKDLQKQGIVLVFGPVLDPQSPYGLAIIEVERTEQVEQLIAQDPAVIAGLMTAEYYPMKAVLPG
ncbi:YciI family protein [Cohnella sp. GbtcB17]|uniref:YciI family protein n=1 Tax=Cohnella sp. GbtcB17 TaxID=2824762 RepID=UPI001C3097DF|nr:YciI family protein [Cohnella sp. GbtcB17]